MSTTERDPTGRSSKDPGAKLDHGKAPVRQGVIEYFPRALLAVAEVSAFGAEKYTWGGWGPVPDGINRYGNAMDRHALKASIEGDTDPETGLLHAAHEAWNALARLEMMLRAQETARPKPDPTPWVGLSRRNLARKIAERINRYRSVRNNQFNN